MIDFLQVVPNDFQDVPSVLCLLKQCPTCNGPSILICQLWTSFVPSYGRILYITCCLTAIKNDHHSLIQLSKKVENVKTKQVDSHKCSSGNPSSWRAVRLMFPIYRNDIDLIVNQHDVVDKSDIYNDRNTQKQLKQMDYITNATDDWLSDFLSLSSTSKMVQEKKNDECREATKGEYDEDLAVLSIKDVCFLSQNIRCYDCIEVIFEMVDVNRSKQKDPLSESKGATMINFLVHNPKVIP